MGRASRRELRDAGASAVFCVVSAVAHGGIARRRGRGGVATHRSQRFAGSCRTLVAGAGGRRASSRRLLQHVCCARRFRDCRSVRHDRPGDLLAVRGGTARRAGKGLGIHDERNRLPRRPLRREGIPGPVGPARERIGARARHRLRDGRRQRSLFRSERTWARGAPAHQGTEARAGVPVSGRAAPRDLLIQRPRAFLRRSVRDLSLRWIAPVERLRRLRPRALADGCSGHAWRRAVGLAGHALSQRRTGTTTRGRQMTMTERQTKASLYVRCAVAADRGAWSVERDIKWAEIDRHRAHARPDLLASLRDAALIESYHPVNLSRLLRATLDDIDAGVTFSLELYEGFKHFHSIRRYLDAIGYEPAITDKELVAIRSAQLESEVMPGELIPRLVDFMLSEHLAHYFFRRLGEQAEDNGLADLLSRIAADEVRHAQSASDLIAKDIDRHPSLIPRVLDAALDFHHFGEQAIGTVPVAQPGDPIAIQTFAKRIERLCGIRLVDHIKNKSMNRRAS